MASSRRDLRVSSTLRLEMRQGGLANPRWMALLGSIDNTHSITAAAKAAGLSYKAAWDAIDAMNNLAGKAVVATSVGGKGGGGARLTPHGRELLVTYRLIAVENEHFVAAMNARLGHAARGVQTLGRLSMRTSARNQWSGKVIRLRRGAVNDEVELKLPGGDRIVAVVTHESTDDLGLAVGSEAFALVKASSVIVGKGGGRRMRLSARNQLAGKITRVTPGAVNTEVVIGLRGSHTVAAVITHASAQELDLKVGQTAVAIIKASSVIVAAM